MLVKFTEENIILSVKVEEQSRILEIAFIEKILNLVNHGDIARCRREDLPDGTPQLIIEKIVGGLQSYQIEGKDKLSNR